MSALSIRAFELLQQGQTDAAVKLAMNACASAPEDFSAWLTLGRCQVALGLLDLAISSLQRADRLSLNSAPLLLELGVAQRKNGDLNAAIATLSRLVALDDDYSVAVGYNSLGLSFKDLGRLDDAAQAYELGAISLVEGWAKTLCNKVDSPRLPFWRSRNNLWVFYGLTAASVLTQRDDGEQIHWPTGWPSGATDVAEAETASAGAEYWLDAHDPKDGKRTRFIQPNYFNTLAAYLQSDGAYAALIGHLSMALDMLGETDKAREHFEEAQDFWPKA